MGSDRNSSGGDKSRLLVDARREFRLDGDTPRYPRLTSGWAAEQVVLSDGRRQVTRIFLPGERVISSPLWHSEACSLLAITPLILRFGSPVSPEEELTVLREEIDRFVAQSFRSAVRLGCLTAYEKTANLLLEVAERAEAPPRANIEFPLTQEMMGDLLGLSQVHVNRTLQQLRRDGLIELQGGRLTILDRNGLGVAGQHRTLFLADRV